ncbi:MAG TPA: DUF4157 domain-containing protein [Pyrinomonadaceae bacterium]|jgi:hypothetical protein|nr:DUF4157 domain-containing protein [Pyrinomonadaceae bacterium]
MFAASEKKRSTQPADAAPPQANSARSQTGAAGPESFWQSIAFHPYRVQRACGPCATGGAPCSECEEEQQNAVQRKADHDEPQASSPENLLTNLGSGRPLDLATRAFFEPRFQRDFSNVRLHSDERATAAARRINALAFTIGNHVAIRQDNFSPGSSAGRRLLGHELTHTIQQASPGFQQKRLISDPQDQAEQEAERVGAALASSDPSDRIHVSASAGAAQIHRDENDQGPHDAGVPPPIAGVPGTEEDQRACVARLGGCPETRDAGLPTAEDIRNYNAECRKEIDYSGPDVQPVCAEEKKEEEVEPPAGGNMAHRKLSKSDKETIVTATGAAASTGTTLAFSKDGPRFVLHDTGTSYGPPDKEKQHLDEDASHGSNPAGVGSGSYVTAAGAPRQIHPQFFNQQRPTATEFEKANDLMDQFTRETTMQKIWSLTNPAAQATAIDAYIALFPNMPTKDVTDEKQKAVQNLDSTKATPSTKPNAKPVVFTTATGAVFNICDLVAAGGAAQLAVQNKDAELVTACQKIKPIIDARKVRIPDTTNVEIVADKGTDCNTTGKLEQFKKYAPAVYDAVAKLYVLASLEAGQYPEITTHYFLDSTTPAGSPGKVTTLQNRCDPRCFDLDLLYAKIAAILNHPKGTTYGITPNYGSNWGVSNVWWPPKVCGSAAPGAPAVTPPAKKAAPDGKK